MSCFPEPGSMLPDFAKGTFADRLFGDVERVMSVWKSQGEATWKGLNPWVLALKMEEEFHEPGTWAPRGWKDKGTDPPPRPPAPPERTSVQYATLGFSQGDSATLQSCCSRPDFACHGSNGKALCRADSRVLWTGNLERNGSLSYTQISPVLTCLMIDIKESSSLIPHGPPQKAL